MAVVTIYMSDRDKTGKTFVSKKDADEHDKKLELAENLSVFLGQRLTFLNDKQREDIGFLLAEHRELLAQALKGKPEVLLDAELAASSADDTGTATGEKAEAAQDNTSKAHDNDSSAPDIETAAAEAPIADKKVRAIGR